jgi:ferredoxin
MACIHTCPMKAVHLRIPEKNPDSRYRNENIGLMELVEANEQKIKVK